MSSGGSKTPRPDIKECEHTPKCGNLGQCRSQRHRLKKKREEGEKSDQFERKREKTSHRVDSHRVLNLCSESEDGTDTDMDMDMDMVEAVSGSVKTEAEWEAIWHRQRAHVRKLQSRARLSNAELKELRAENSRLTDELNAYKQREDIDDHDKEVGYGLRKLVKGQVYTAIAITCIMFIRCSGVGREAAGVLLSRLVFALTGYVLAPISKRTVGRWSLLMGQLQHAELTRRSADLRPRAL